jgi:nucleotide-binding universal stress UspA family protein
VSPAGRGTSGPLIAGYDGRAAGHDALSLADSLAGVRGDPMIAACVSEPQQLFAANDRRRQREVMQRLGVLREEVDATLPETRGAHTVSVRDIAAPTPARGLHDLATAENARAIVLGSTHHGPLGRVAVGATGARLLHQAPCAVAVAPAGFRERERHGFESVAVAIDGCAECQDALHEAMSLTSALAARLVALAVVPLPGPLRALSRHSGERVVDSVDAMLERIGVRGVERLVLNGAPGRALSHASAGFDLLVLGCRTTGGPFGHPTVRSVSRELMHSASVPVIVVPERARPAEAAVPAPASEAPS